MIILKSLVTVGALALLAGCSGPAVHYDYDARAGFAQYRTYDWQATPPKQGGMPIMDARVRREVDKALAAKAFRQETTGSPDILLSAQTVYHPKRRGRLSIGIGGAFLPGLGVGVGTSVGGHQAGMIGSIVLEVEDFKTRQLVWKCTSEPVLDTDESPQDLDEDVSKTVTAMLAKLPSH
jgi:hypothetical protein